MKPYVTAFAKGVTIGLIISLIASILFGDGTYFPTNPASTMGCWYLEHTTQVEVMAISILLWGMIGLLFQAARQIFMQNWSLLKMTLCHFGISLLGMFPLGILAGWFSWNIGYVLSFALEFSLIYAAIYVISYHSMRKEIAAINAGLGK